MKILKSFGKSIEKKNYWLLLPFLVIGSVYIDIINLGNYTIPNYVLINIIEFTLIFSGISIGYWTCFFQYELHKKNGDSL